MKRLILILLALLLLPGCASSGAGQDGRAIVDGEGRTVHVPQTVERIVCVGVGALRYTCYMECADRVVGVEDCETEPVISRLYNYVNIDHFRDKPIIGGNGTPDAESIIEADPQVIILSAYAGVAADDLQQKTGIPVVVVPGSDATLDDKCYQTITILGALLGKEQRAAVLTVWLKSLESELSGLRGAKTSVYVGGVSYKGHHGFEGTEAGYGPLKLLGANNLADTTGQTGAFNIDKEQVLTWDPDVIFLDFNGMALINEDYAKNPGYYESLTAVQEGRVYSQISFRSNAANLETALADAYYCASVLYPGTVDVDAKVREIYTALLGTDPSDALKEAGYEFRPLTLGE